MLVLAAVSSMSACIIPVAPEFQDPPQTQHPAPVFVSETPEFNTLQPVVPQDFTVLVGGSTPGITLWYRWELDYPAFPDKARQGADSTPLPLPTNGLPAKILISLSCNINPDPSIGLQHSVTLFVADQKFVMDAIDTIPDPTIGYVIQGSWQVDMSCGVPQ